MSPTFCRLFKNISYGRMVSTNSKRAYDFFGGKILFADSVIGAVDAAITFESHPTSIKKKHIEPLMMYVQTHHTYVTKIENIFRAFGQLTTSCFDYIIDKIMTAPIVPDPFPHLEILGFLNESHLSAVLLSEQVHFAPAQDDDELFGLLAKAGYDIQHFPGCKNTWDEYVEELRRGKPSTGLTFRLNNIKHPVVGALIRFMNGPASHEALRERFSIAGDTTILSAVQKNLTGYEIPPHPDIRQKALTYLLNINKSQEVEKTDCHTHLLKFKDEFKFVEREWSKSTGTNRCWVPWDWCDTVKTIRTNNAMVVFRPGSQPASLHAIKLDYNHLPFQRTQIYGNLLYSKHPEYKTQTAQDLLSTKRASDL